MFVETLVVTVCLCRQWSSDVCTDSSGGKCLCGADRGVYVQTLAVTWIKASLNVVVSADLWDQLTCVLSSLTGWVELIREWAVSQVAIVAVVLLNS